MKQTIFVAPILSRWKSAFESPNCPYPFLFDVSSVGFLEVFFTIEEYREIYPDVNPLIFTVEEKE